MSDLTTMRTQLREMLGNPSTSDVPDATLTSRLNFAYQEIATKYKFHKARKICTFDTVADQTKYGLPTDCFAVLRVRDNTNKKRIKKMGDDSYSDRTSTVSGKPDRYVRQRDWIAIEPTPDDVYELEIYYSTLVATLSADGDTPVIPGAWHIGIVRYARVIHWDMTGDLAKMAVAQQSYDKWVSTMPLEFDEEAERFDSPVEVTSLSRNVTPAQDFDHSE